MFARKYKLKDFTSSIILLLIGVGIYIVFVPLLFLFIPLVIGIKINNIRINNEYRKFLYEMEGTIFFCYNNRSKTKDFIENEILPVLPSDFEIIYLNGKTPLSDYDREFISKILYNLEGKKGFPSLIKILNGKVVSKSINNEVHNAVNQGKNISEISKIISSFLQSF